MRYLKRGMERKFTELSKHFRVLLLTGARQVGKTTMLRHLALNTSRTYASLDDIRIRQLAKSDPDLFFQMYPPPVLIDEVQYAPELFPYIKLMADSAEERGLFWLTGSQHYTAIRAVQESLAGRIAILEMLGLSQAERHGTLLPDPPDYGFVNWQQRMQQISLPSAPQIYEYIWRGGLPEAQQVSPEARDTLLHSYVQSYLMRDVAELGGVRDLVAFQKLLTAAASLVGQQLSYASLAATAGISQPTAKAWVHLLEGLGILYLLPAFSTNVLKRLVKTPKLYFTDTGLAAWLAGWPTPDTLMNGAASGAFLENYVVTEFLKTYSYAPVKANLSYYRDKDGREIDLIVEQDRVLHPFEIKRTGNPDRRDTRRFSVLDRGDFKRGPGGIICLSSNVYPATAMDSMIPVGLLD